MLLKVSFLDLTLNRFKKTPHVFIFFFLLTDLGSFHVILIKTIKNIMINPKQRNKPKKQFLSILF